MSKSLIFSDLHLHSHKNRTDRLQDCLKVLNWIFDQAKEHKCENIIFLGDLFHERSKIDVLNYLRTFECFMKHMLDNPPYDVWLLIGNHDMYHRERWDVNTIKPLTAIPKVHVVDKPCTLEIGGRSIDFLPHVENPLGYLEELENSPSELLFAHIAVHGAELNSIYGIKSDVIIEHDGEMKPVSIDCFKKWKTTILGHYHGAQNLNKKVEYIGSPLQLSFGEAFQEKHILILNLNNLKKEYIVNDFSPQHFIISPDNFDSYDLNNNFVRIVVDNIGSDELVDLKRTINKDYNVASFDFKQKDRKIDENKIILEEAKTILMKEDEMLENYVNAAKIPDSLDKDMLIKIGKDICQTQN